MRFYIRWTLLVSFMLTCRASLMPAMDGQKAFAFVSPQYIVTAEIASARSFTINFINFSDFVIVVQPNDLIYKAANGQLFIGQVYDKEYKTNRGDTFRYSASVLLKGRSFTGLTVLGAFREQDQIEELSIRIGAKRYYLQPMEKGQFEQIAARVGELDLKTESPRAELVAANIPEMGSVTTTDGTSEWDRDWKTLLKPDGTNPPKIIERPDITPTDDAKRARAYGRVRLSAVITRNGTIQDLRVERGLGHGMDERVTEAIKNSWIFLPATRNGEVLETTIFFEVDFPPPNVQK